MIYNLEALRRAWLAGEKFKFLFFWGHTPTADWRVTESCFSQWWSCRFTVDGVTYSCAEQFMMAEKARMFSDTAMLKAILNANHPKEMKAFGRAVQGFDKERWDNACYEIVVRGSVEKFRQNPELMDFLVGTKNRILVDASPRDRIWGIGMGKQNPDAENPMKWRGTNLLGFALSEARNRLMSE